MTYSDAEKRAAAEQVLAATYYEFLQWEQSYRDEFIAGLVAGRDKTRTSAMLPIQCLVNRQRREIEEAVRIIRKGFGEGCLEDFSALEESAFAWLARNTESK